MTLLAELERPQLQRKQEVSLACVQLVHVKEITVFSPLFCICHVLTTDMISLCGQFIFTILHLRHKMEHQTLHNVCNSVHKNFYLIFT